MWPCWWLSVLWWYEELVSKYCLPAQSRVIEKQLEGKFELATAFIFNLWIGWCQMQPHCQDRKCWGRLENVLIISALFIQDIWPAQLGMTFPFGNVSQNAPDRKSASGGCVRSLVRLCENAHLFLCWPRDPTGVTVSTPATLTCHTTVPDPSLVCWPHLCHSFLI